ncbi:MAG: lipid A biosynthesis acyltransferase [Winogradskyella sp.]|nr:lysophospholipid acyltransferase family protein [Winogradskyella sp.]NNC45861.1 lipid A biosynthesis acyltransferase [Winogradskyella sp.]NNF86744.1 lipid A biosynthesis acyltransferase [Winogradskyella sp.]NNK40670.1 lipid A biosynthesis acyltransferase [Winogradskyella sp.]NNL83792.1 lipid A biosynthesis acyltransferase [Winogradskyella sp.]
MQLIAYILIYPFLWVISILPFRLLYAFSDVLYFFIYKIFGYRKRTVKANLKLVFPDKSDKEIKEISNKFYHHLCDMILEALKSLTISEKELLKRFTFKNIEVIKALEDEKKNIVLMCGHYGSWEWIFIMQNFVNHKGYAVYKQLANKYFDKLVKRIRAKYDTHLITTKETFVVLADSVKSGELSISGFVADQSPKANKAFHWQDFLGIKVPVHTGAELIAKRFNMAVVYFGVKRLKRGYYETTFHIITKEPNTYKDYEITDQFLSLLEKQIYEAPEYYLWTHKRWKHKDKVPEEFLNTEA